MAGNSAQAYQATFNLQVANDPGQTSRTFTDGTPTDHTMVMTVTSLTQITGGTGLNVTTDDSAAGPNNAGFGLCVISTTCGAANQAPTAATFSFTKPVELGLYNNFKVGRINGDWTNYSLQLFVGGIQQGNNIALSSLAQGNTFNFFSSSSLLLAANNAITVGLACTGTSCSAITPSEQFYISDVIVEAPAPLPLIGTGAAFAWTRRLRRRIKATPGTSSQV